MKRREGGMGVGWGSCRIRAWDVGVPVYHVCARFGSVLVLGVDGILARQVLRVGNGQCALEICLRFNLETRAEFVSEMHVPLCRP